MRAPAALVRWRQVDQQRHRASFRRACCIHPSRIVVVHAVFSSWRVSYDLDGLDPPDVDIEQRGRTLSDRPAQIELGE
eukprot:3584697-Prymnesium_polylepis.1